jgi:flagellar biosynthesis/type III secretory pathway chaperone
MLEQSTFVANCLEDSGCQGYFTTLIDVMKKELAIYSDLKEFLNDEKQLIMESATLEQINASNGIKENIILKARILEEVRTNILKKIARNLDMDEKAITLTSLANYAVIEQRQVIDQLKRALLDIAQDIRNVNDENAYLLDSSINSINGSLDFISSLMNRSGIYMENGSINEVKRRGRLLATEG